VAAAKKMMKYKNARTPIEVEQKTKLENPNASETEVKELAERKCSELEARGLLIRQWDLDFVGADLTWCGRNGSPTKVHRIQSVVLATKETKNVEPSDRGISDMIHELIEDKIIA
jgi:electron transfer flavoprotein beta subunit